MIRVIYMVEGFTQDGELHVRRFARNRKTAERIERQIRQDGAEAKLIPVRRCDWQHINPEWIEG